MEDARDQLRDALLRQLHDASVGTAWERLHDAGVLGLLVPEALGGLELTIADAEPVFDVLGEHGLATSFLESAIVAPLLLAPERTPAGDAALRALVDDGARIAIAGFDRRLRGQVSATPTAGGWRLDGDAKLVLDGDHAGSIIVAARTEAFATALLLVERAQPGVTAQTYPTIDGRSAADLRFIAADARLLSADASEALTNATDAALACLAVEAAALMRRLVADTVAYAKQREQFGQPIAAFQVVQHRLVDMHIQARRAGAIARRAIASADGPWRERGRLASAAKAAVAAAGRFVGQQAVQLHGGMGMTEELPVGRYFKRLTVIEHELGGQADHVRRYGELAA